MNFTTLTFLYLSGTFAGLLVLYIHYIRRKYLEGRHNEIYEKEIVGIDYSVWAVICCLWGPALILVTLLILDHFLSPHSIAFHIGLAKRKKENQDG